MQEAEELSDELSPGADGGKSETGSEKECTIHRFRGWTAVYIHRHDLDRSHAINYQIK